jgi:MFS family permease
MQNPQEGSGPVTHAITASPARTISSATAITIAGIMPTFLVGASGVFIRADLGFDEAGLGLAVGAFMAASAALGIPGGRLTERIGAGRALTLVGFGSAAVMLGIATLADRLAHLVVLLAIAGACNSLSNPAANLAIARGSFIRPGLMFGVKQSAMPAATLLAGGSIPLISLTIGWRWAFVLGALLAVGAAISAPRRLGPGLVRSRGRVREGDAPTAPLILLAIALGIGTAAAVSLGSFLVESLVAGGIDAGTAGWMLAGGSATGILARLISGALTDRRPNSALLLMAAMLVFGAAGYLLLARGGSMLLLAGTILAFSCGWGWHGLLFFAVVRLNPNAPAAATGIVTTGGAGGAALGPLAFGLVVTNASYPLAWQLAAAAALASAALVVISRAWLHGAGVPAGQERH